VQNEGSKRRNDVVISKVTIMVDKFNAIGLPGSIRPDLQGKQNLSADQVANGKDFKSMLMDSISEVNRLQTEADEATNNYVVNGTGNVAEVFTAVKKAEMAFQTLVQMRTTLLDAYEEIKQMRV
jgi:flagellar hook-basal body complex protein FliE